MSVLTGQFVCVCVFQNGEVAPRGGVLTRRPRGETPRRPLPLLSAARLHYRRHTSRGQGSGRIGTDTQHGHLPTYAADRVNTQA